LWKSKRPDLLTQDQLKLMTHKIHLQGQGYGIMPKYNNALSPIEDGKSFLKYYRNYWGNTQGINVIYK
jgi:hypothetical protein